MKVGVVGGGISGLACAHYLRKAGVGCVVFDPAPGGLIGSVTVEGCRLERGPESWLASKPWAEELIRELGMGDEIVGSNDARRRTYIVRNNRFEALPRGVQLVVPTRALPVFNSPLLGWGTKLKMAIEIFRNPTSLPDRSVASFVADHFGPEAVDYLAEPLLAGVYGGSPELLSAASVFPKFVEYEQRFGSIIAGVLREKKAAPGQPIFKSLRNGMGTMIDALRQNTTIVTASVESIEFHDRWRVLAEGAWHEFHAIVLCCGANHAGTLLTPIEPRIGELLASVPHASSAVWSLGYRREDVLHALDAFGFLVPKRERAAIMACTWVATKWPGRIPEGKTVLRCFSTNVNVAQDAVRADLNRLMGIKSEPLFAFRNQFPDAMPQYTVGHSERVAEIEERIAAIPGLHLAGNAYRGIGIPDCVLSGKLAAEAITRSRL